MSNFTELIKLHTSAVELTKLFDTNLAQFEIALDIHCNDIKNTFEKKYSDITLELLTNLSGGCRCEDWNPHIIYYFASREHRYYLNKKYGWFYSDTYDVTIFNYKKAEFPFSNEEIKELERNLQYDNIYAKPYTKEIKVTTEKLRNFNDIQLFLGEQTSLITSGKIWYPGWEISDEWYIVENNKKYYVFWATNGHELGLDNSFPILEKDANFVFDKSRNLQRLHQFFNWLNSQTENNSVETEYKKTIIDSWE